MTEFSAVQIEAFIAMLQKAVAPLGYKIVPLDAAEEASSEDSEPKPPKPKPKKGLKSVTGFLKK